MSQFRYLSVYASPVKRYPPYDKHIMHVAGSGAWTLCGRRLSDPYTVYLESGHQLCAICDKRKVYAR